MGVKHLMLETLWTSLPTKPSFPSVWWTCVKTEIPEWNGLQLSKHSLASVPINGQAKMSTGCTISLLHQLESPRTWSKLPHLTLATSRKLRRGRRQRLYRCGGSLSLTTFKGPMRKGSSLSTICLTSTPSTQPMMWHPSTSRSQEINASPTSWGTPSLPAPTSLTMILTTMLWSWTFPGVDLLTSKSRWIDLGDTNLAMMELPMSSISCIRPRSHKENTRTQSKWIHPYLEITSSTTLAKQWIWDN